MTVWQTGSVTTRVRTVLEGNHEDAITAVNCKEVHGTGSARQRRRSVNDDARLCCVNISPIKRCLERDTLIPSPHADKQE